MNKIVFTEEFCQPENLHPFTLTRQIQDIRIGILTIREKWEVSLGLPSFDRKEDDYKDLERSVDIAECVGEHKCYMIHGNLLPTPKIVRAVRKLKAGEFLSAGGNEGVVFCITGNEIADLHKIKVTGSVLLNEPVRTISFPWEIFQINDWALRQDYELLTQKRKSKPVSKTNNVINRSAIFIEKGARVEYSTLNADAGPIYIGKNAQIMEGCVIRGPFALGPNSIVKAGTTIYGATTVGPHSTVGGEIKNSVIFGYSNKAHGGYLGDSVIGEWCNLGAGTTNSNLKNNAGTVRIWTAKGYQPAGRKCGVMMGDYSKTSINTSINTGTVIGVACNVFGSGLTPKYIPSFSWGSEGVNRYEFDQLLRDLDNWKILKNETITDSEKSILKYIYQNY